MSLVAAEPTNEMIKLVAPPKPIVLSCQDATSAGMAAVATITLYEGQVDVGRLRKAFHDVIQANPNPRISCSR